MERMPYDGNPTPTEFAELQRVHAQLIQQSAQTEENKAHEIKKLYEEVLRLEESTRFLKDLVRLQARYIARDNN